MMAKEKFCYVFKATKYFGSTYRNKATNLTTISSHKKCDGAFFFTLFSTSNFFSPFQQDFSVAVYVKRAQVHPYLEHPQVSNL